MEISKFRYKICREAQRQYLDGSTAEVRAKLNSAFRTAVAEGETTGIFGKYMKRGGYYRIKYIYTRNRQLQPQTFDRYYYILTVGSDSKGSYVEYTEVYDKLYDPLIRLVYILSALAVIGYLFYMYKKQIMSPMSVGVLSAVIAASVLVLFKKPRETAEECTKAEKILEKVISGFDFD